MKTYALSMRSMEKLRSCHPDIQLIFQEAIKVSPIDFGISHGKRPPEEQLELFKLGRVPLEGGGYSIANRGQVVTYKDGYEKKSKHNFTPSQAVDLYCWPKKIMYDEKHLSVVGGVVMATASRLFDEGKISHRLKWGNDWNMDGVMIHKDPRERFTDLPHFELVIQ